MPAAKRRQTHSLGREPQDTERYFSGALTGRQTAPAARAAGICSVLSVAASRLCFIFLDAILGLTPQANCLSRLRRSALRRAGSGCRFAPSALGAQMGGWSGANWVKSRTLFSAKEKL